MRIRNRWKYAGNDRWDWEAFLDDGGTGLLDDVRSVDYVLHPTFPKPLRAITTRDNQFAMQSNGWGTFELKAFVNMKDGSRKKLVHQVELCDDPAEGVSA
jgi:transcription initiation factor IIF auxiliary subunit